MDHVILARRLDLEIVNKARTCRFVDFGIPTDHKEKWKKYKYIDLARDLENMGHESDGDTNSNLCVLYNHKRINNGIRGLENKRMS